MLRVVGFQMEVMFEWFLQRYVSKLSLVERGAYDFLFSVAVSAFHNRVLILGMDV